MYDLCCLMRYGNIYIYIERERERESVKYKEEDSRLCEFYVRFILFMSPARKIHAWSMRNCCSAGHVSLLHTKLAPHFPFLIY